MQLEQIINNMLSCNDVHIVAEDGSTLVERKAPKSAMLIAARTLLLQQRQIEELSAIIIRAGNSGFDIANQEVVE